MLNLKRRFRDIAERWQAFANIGEDGSYGFTSQLVMLNSVEQAHVSAVMAKRAAGRFKVLHLAAHEYTHWLDHVSTLWGRASLRLFHRAYEATELNDEHEFGPAIVDAWDFVGRIRSDVYFRVLGELGKDTHWAADFSAGLRFSIRGVPDETDPIVFIRFFDPRVSGPSRSSLIARTPLSVLSLTECTAQAAEFRWISAEAADYGGNTPANPATWLSSLLSSLYDRDNCFYSAVFHSVANTANIRDTATAVEVAPALATLALNLPSEAYTELRSASGLPADWYKRVAGLHHHRDPGCALLVLLSHRVPYTGQSASAWVDEVLRAGGLKGLSAVEKGWRAELSQGSEPAPLVSPRLMSTLQLGESWALERGILGDAAPLVGALNGNSNLKLPHAILGDESTWSPTGEDVDFGDSLGPIEWFERHCHTEAMMKDFLTACRRA